MRALTGLKQAGLVAQGVDINGQLAQMALTKIHVDPNNSRRPEDECSPEGLQEQYELTADIKKRGVKSPISLRPHPEIPGEYMVNFGHRRLIGAAQAGLTTIPYFLDEAFDSYDQVKENLLHRKPSVWALANFVQRMLNEKQTKSQIAEGLGKSSQNLVTELQALVDAPTCLHSAYEMGVTSTRTLYDLRRAYDEYSDQVEAWCASGAKITRTSIQEFVSQLHQDKVGTGSGSVLSAAQRTHVSQTTTTRVEGGALTHVVTEITTPDAASTGTSDSGATTAAHRLNTPDALAELRHDVKGQSLPAIARMHIEPSKSADTPEDVLIEYKGRRAKIAPDATVKILVEGEKVPLSVPVSELMFKQKL